MNKWKEGQNDNNGQSSGNDKEIQVLMGGKRTISHLMGTSGRRGIWCSHFCPLILFDVVEEQIIVHVHLNNRIDRI
jgi:hypothetical protein